MTFSINKYKDTETGKQMIRLRIEIDLFNRGTGSIDLSIYLKRLQKNELLNEHNS